MEYYFKALKVSEETGDKLSQSKNQNNIGLVYTNLTDYTNALKYHFKALEIYEEIGNKSEIPKILCNIGICYTYKADYIKAIEFNFKALDYNEKIGEKRSIAINLGSIGNIYNFQSDYSKALSYYFKALKIHEEIGNKHGQVIYYGNIGAIYTKMKKYKEAEKYIKLSFSVSKKIGAQDQLKGIHQMFYELYEATKRPTLALEHYKKHIALRDSLFSEENQKATMQKEMQFNYDKKAATDSIANAKEAEIKNIEIEKQQVEIKAKKNQQYALVGGLFLVLVFAGFMYNRFKVTQKQKHIITQQKHLVEEKHKEITDSINYAERIQRSFLATTEMLDQHLKDYFVFFRPKDVVSGDFYWAGELNNGNFAFSVADSTGHGVPGAIMSILNISSLEKSIEKETDPDRILNETRKIIIERLKKDGSSEGGKDGMDCSLLVFNQDRTQLTLSAANNPVFIVRDNRLLEYKPDKMPVGKHDNDEESFTLHTILLQKGDVIYTLTDGFSDQFGGTMGKKYMIKNLKELLLQIDHLPMLEQEQKLADEFDKWKGAIEQVDDVCVIGVRI